MILQTTGKISEFRIVPGRRLRPQIAAIIYAKRERHSKTARAIAVAGRLREMPIPARGLRMSALMREANGIAS